jgi:hypothetical protein
LLLASGFGNPSLESGLLSVQEIANVFGKSWRETARHVAQSMVCAFLILALTSCAQSKGVAKTPSKPTLNRTAAVEEVSPPDSIQRLGSAMNDYRPQVKIVGVKPDTTLEETSVTIRFDVDGFPIYKDPELGLGPHLHVFLDDQPYQAIYDAKQEVTFNNLQPGTHTIRAFASRPWHESFKTPGAFASLTFNVLVPMRENRPEPTQPLLTYSRPQGEYGAEPIMLDYYLTPLRSVLGDEPGFATSSPQVRVTINGNSFVTSEEPPLYLKGFKLGQNWVKLELLDAKGKAIPNAFSESVRIVTLKANGQDTLSKLVSGELSAQAAESIVDREVSERKAAERLETEREASRREAAQKLETAKREAAGRDALEREAAKRQVLESKPVVPVVPIPARTQVGSPPTARPAATPAVMATPTPAVQSKRLPSPPATMVPSPRTTIPNSTVVKAKPQASEAPVQPLESASPPKSLSPQIPSTETATSKAAPFWSKFKPDELLKGLNMGSADKAEPVLTVPPAPIPVLPTTERPSVAPTPPVVRRSVTTPSPTPSPSPQPVSSIPPTQPQAGTAVGNTLKSPIADWRKLLPFPQQPAKQTPTVTPTEPQKMQESERLNPEEMLSKIKLQPIPTP